MDKVGVVKGFYEAFVAGDLAGCIARLHSDLVVDEPSGLPYGGYYEGVEGFQKLVAAMLADYELALVEWSVHDAGDFVAGRLLGRFTSRATGRSLDMPVVEHCYVTDDRISRIDVFYKDTRAFVDAVG